MNKRERVIELLGNKCAKCGYNKDIRCLELDHINEDGYIEDQEYKRQHIQTFIIDVFELNNSVLIDFVQLRYQILCVMCHRVKTIENRSLPPEQQAKRIAKQWNDFYYLGVAFRFVQKHKTITI